MFTVVYRHLVPLHAAFLVDKLSWGPKPGCVT